MADKDKPKVHSSFSQFDDVDVEEFVYMTKDNQRIVFPDPYGDSMDPDDAEDMMDEASAGRLKSRELLKRWLPGADVEKFLADRLNLRKRAEILNAAIDHYQKKFGTPGEDSASKS